MQPAHASSDYSCTDKLKLYIGQAVQMPQGSNSLWPSATNN